MQIRLAKSKKDIESCYPVMTQLRPPILSKEELLRRVVKQQKGGYQLAFVKNRSRVVAVAGFRILDNLAYKKFLYVDDFVTDEKSRSKGYGGALFDWLVDYAKKAKCKELHLDSGVHRFDAHRFYLKKRMYISAHHFGLTLS